MWWIDLTRSLQPSKDYLGSNGEGVTMPFRKNGYVFCLESIKT